MPAVFGKPQMNTPFLETTNLRIVIQVCHFILGSINIQCMFSLVYSLLPEAANRVEVFCKKSCSWKFYKFHRKAPFAVLSHLSLLPSSYHSYHFQILVWQNLITLFGSQRNADTKLKSIETLHHQSCALSSW